MQREQTKQQAITKENQQQAITKENQQQNTDSLTKTAPAMVQEKTEDAVLNKILRRPRSKKKLKLYAEVDLPSMADEEIMERMRKERASGAADGGSWGDGAGGDGTEGDGTEGDGTGGDIGTEDISKEDIAAYLQSRQEEFIKMVQGEIKEEEEKAAEEERKRKEEEERERQRSAEEERKREEARKLAELAKKKIGVLCQCLISGCYVHFIPNRGGWAGVQHYSRGGVPKQFKPALNLYEKYKGRQCVEIYDDRLVVIAEHGEVLKIEKIEET